MKKFIVPIVSVVALVVGLLGLFTRHSIAPATNTGNLGGVVDVKNGGSTFANGADFGAPTPVTVNWAGDKIYPKANQASWKNTTGQTQYVDLVELSTDNTASSSFKVYAMATSTALRSLYDFVAPVSNRSFINGWLIATSSAATTTSNMASGNSNQGLGVVQVPDGSYVNFYIVTAQTSGATCKSSAGTCESATSTNRGFNAFWRVRYHN